MNTLPMDDQRAFTLTYTRTYPKVLAYMRRRSESNIAPDLTAEVFIRAWNARTQLFQADHELAWLYGIARNVLLEHYRQRERKHAADHSGAHQHHNTDPVSGTDHLRKRHAASDTAPLTGTAPDEIALVDTTLDILHALSTLSPADQEILTLHAWEDLDAPEIAEVLGISASAARVRLHRARGRLATALHGVEETHRNNHTNDKGAQ